MNLLDRDEIAAAEDGEFEIMLTAPKFEVRHKGRCIDPGQLNRRELERRINQFPKLIKALRVARSYVGKGLDDLDLKDANAEIDSALAGVDVTL